MSIKKAIQNAFDGKLADMQDEFRSDINERAVNALNEKKIQIAKTSLIKDK